MSTIAQQMRQRLEEELSNSRASGQQATAPKRPAPAPASSLLPPLGPQTRPNGRVYYPRLVGVLEDLAFLRDARDHGEHVLLTGPPGTGKTALAEAAFAMDATAAHTGLETIVGTESTEEADFLGTFLQNPVTGVWEWLHGPLTRSVENDVPLLVDEIALINPRVLAVLYALMDGRGELLVPMNPALPPIKVGPGWSVIGACNPDVPGAHMSDALLSRFQHHIEVTTDWDLAADLGVPAGLITVAKNLETRTKLATPTYDGWIPQLRDVLAFSEASSRYGEPFAVASLLRKCPAQDRIEFTTAMKKSFAVSDPLGLGARARAGRP